MKLASLVSIVAALVLVDAHGDHGKATDLKEKVPEGLTWEQWHMKKEHSLDEYDAESFFTLHDIKNKGYFDGNDILNMYGLLRDEVVGKGDGLGDHDDSEVITDETKFNIIKQIMTLIDPNHDNKITKEEYLKYKSGGGVLPDLGVGIGHHGDFEHEYEVHHWNKYHKDQDPEINIVHKEDIEHELLHHEHEIEHEFSDQGEKLSDSEFELKINLNNIPQFFKNL